MQETREEKGERKKQQQQTTKDGRGEEEESWEGWMDGERGREKSGWISRALDHILIALQHMRDLLWMSLGQSLVAVCFDRVHGSNSSNGAAEL